MSHHHDHHASGDQHIANPAFDPNDPHGIISAQGHGHVIVSARMLLLVLGVLLVFTVLTVFLAQAEKWFAAAFGMELPQSVNVAVAMSIATIKSIMVAMFFMQLKYDNKLHTLIMCFCLLAFGCFLGFTALDLSSRGRIDTVKANEILPGGTGKNGLERYKLVNGQRVAATDENGKPKLNDKGKVIFAKEVIDKPIYLWAKETAQERLSPAGYAAAEAAHHGHAEEPVSTANRSVLMVGPRLFAEHHEQGHSEPGAPEPGHSEPAEGH